MNRPWRLARIIVLVSVIASPFLLGGGCDSNFDRFRDAARPGLEAGTRYILDGLVSGIFNLVDLEREGTGAGGSPGASSGLTGGLPGLDTGSTGG